MWWLSYKIYVYSEKIKYLSSKPWRNCSSLLFKNTTRVCNITEKAGKEYAAENLSYKLETGNRISGLRVPSGARVGTRLCSDKQRGSFHFEIKLFLYLHYMCRNNYIINLFIVLIIYIIISSSHYIILLHV